MNLRLIDFPEPATLDDYELAIQHVIRLLNKQTGLIAVLQFGNVSAPGISDIDLLAVFQNHASCQINPLEILNERYRKLFTHNVDAITENHLNDFFTFTLLDRFRIIAGDLKWKQKLPEGDDLKMLKRQIAAEYLVANYIDLAMQHAYRVIRVRNLLQHLKGLKSDFEYIDIKNPLLDACIDELIDWRNNWFNNAQPSNKQLSQWFCNFYLNFKEFTEQFISDHPLYLPANSRIKLSSRIQWRPSDHLSAVRTGIRLPSRWIRNKVFYKRNQRLNSWKLFIPSVSHTRHELLRTRYAFFESLHASNKVSFPYFHTFSTGIT